MKVQRVEAGEYIIQDKRGSVPWCTDSWAWQLMSFFLRMETNSIMRTIITHPGHYQSEILFPALHWWGQRSVSASAALHWDCALCSKALQKWRWDLNLWWFNGKKVFPTPRLSCKTLDLIAMVSTNLSKHKSQLACPPQWELLAELDALWSKRAHEK